MNLKNMFFKFTSTSLAILLLSGNFAICGLGLSEVIAQDQEGPSLEISSEVSKYVKYTGENYSGATIQTHVELQPQMEENNFIPVKYVEMEVTAPKINECFPESAKVVLANTGNENIDNIKQDYSSGLLTVTYENNLTENAFEENVKDEFEIIYIYPAEAYTENEKVSLKYSVEATIAFENDNATASAWASKEFLETKTENNISSIETFNLTKVENEIYKGFLYSNEENNTAYETEYETIVTYGLLNSNLVTEPTMELKQSKFVLNSEEEIGDSNIVYKSTQITKSDFDRILGQDGFIEIYQDEEIKATVKYIEVSENEETVKRLAIEYSNENIEILSEEDTTINIVYPEALNSLKVKMSKPISEGYINFKNVNLIKATKDYGCKVEDIKSIKAINTINDNEEITTINLQEPKTKVTVTSSNINFSTLQNSNTTITVNLDNTNSSAKLFNNPTIEVKLPEGLTGGNLSSPQIVNGNGLKIKNATAENNVITIQLEGKQASYDINNVSGGTSIVMDIENISFDSTMPTHSDKIVATCIQGEEEVQATCNINVVSKSGLLVLSQLSNYDNSGNILTTIDSNLKTVEIKEQDEAKEVAQVINLVNNYEEKLTNVQIVGRIGYSDEVISSTFDTQLTKPVEVSDETAKVYYSNNKEATYEDESWTEEFSDQAKLYKIVLNNNEMASKSTLTLKIYEKVPANIDYNQKTYLKTDVNYTYNNDNLNESSTIGMLTAVNILLKSTNTINTEIKTNEGAIVPISLSITPTLTEQYVRSNQIVTYKIKIANNGEKDLKDIAITDIIPEGAIYVYNEEKEGVGANYIDLVEVPNVTEKIFEINTLKAGKVKEFEIMLKMKNVTAEESVTNKISLKQNEQTVIVENTLQLKPTELSTSLSTSADQIIGKTYAAGDKVQYRIKVKNTSEENKKDIKVQYEIPENLSYVDGGNSSYDMFDGYTIEEQGTLNNNTFEYTINKLNAGEEATIIVIAEVKQLEDNYEANITGIAKVYLAEEVYETNVNTITTKQAAFEISLKADTKGKETLVKDDKIVYEITVKNIGEISRGINIADTIPEQLEVLKLEYDVNGENKYSLETSNSNIKLTNVLEPSDVLTIKITAKVKNIEVQEDTTITIVNRAALSTGAITLDSNDVQTKIKPEVKIDDSNNEDNEIENPEDQTPEDETPEVDNPEVDNPEVDNPDNENTEVEDTKKLYTISGTAWLDEDKDGQKDENEKLQNNVVVTLVSKETGNFVLDSNGNKITTTTDENGKYTFANIEKGTYIILFEFDTNTYTVTTYQKVNVSENLNSDAILTNVTIDGQKKLAAITDNIVLEANEENLNIGLIERPIFDLSLNKEITKITVVNSQGTETVEYENGETAKIDLVAKYMNTANVIVNYKFTVTNEGDVTGYVNSLVDDLPSGLEFSSELNKQWYKGSDGKLYTTALSGVAINPGESTQIELVLTKVMTEDNAGIFPNSAELVEISNLENIAEKDEALENNKSSATLIISIKTGSVIMYIGITILCLSIICAGAYLIKKKVLNASI